MTLPVTRTLYFSIVFILSFCILFIESLRDIEFESIIVIVHNMNRAWRIKKNDCDEKEQNNVSTGFFSSYDSVAYQLSGKSKIV